MIHPKPTRLRPRAPRVILSECVFATMQLENGREIPAKLQRISLTGGLLDLAVYVEERISVGLTLPLNAGSVVQARAEMLFPMRTLTGYLQPFRFTAFGEGQLYILNRELSELLRHASVAARHGIGVNPPSFLLESL